MKRLLCLATVSAAFLCLVAPAYADTVTFENGDRLSGRIVGEEDGKVILEVPGIGEVRIDADRIVSSEVEGSIPAFAFIKFGRSASEMVKAQRATPSGRL